MIRVVLRSEPLTFALNETTRAQVERALGLAFCYPGLGWHTYATREGERRSLLSAFYAKGMLIAVELYVPRSEGAPDLDPLDLGGFSLEPGGARIGMGIERIGEPFAAATNTLRPIVYEHVFEARFTGGLAYAMGREGVIERLALYAQLPPQAA